jgi:hypothetical protein
MEIIKKLGLDDLEVIILIDKRKKNKQMEYRLSCSNSESKYVELFILNSYFVKFIKQNAEDIKIELYKIQNQFELDDDDTSGTSLFTQSIKSMFLTHISKQNIEDAIEAEIKNGKNIPTKFDIKENKSPFAIQRAEDNSISDYICVLHISKSSDLHQKKNLLFLQTHNAIAKSGVQSISKIINVSRIEDNMLDILGISNQGRDIIKSGGGILYIQSSTVNPKLRGMYEIVNV